MVPAGDNSELSVFRRVLVDIGDEQSIEQSLSTFSSHMGHIVRILDEAERDGGLRVVTCCKGFLRVERQKNRDIAWPIWVLPMRMGMA